MNESDSDSFINVKTFQAVFNILLWLPGAFDSRLPIRQGVWGTAPGPIWATQFPKLLTRPSLENSCIRRCWLCYRHRPSQLEPALYFLGYNHHHAYIEHYCHCNTFVWFHHHLRERHPASNLIRKSENLVTKFRSYVLYANLQDPGADRLFKLANG